MDGINNFGNSTRRAFLFLGSKLYSYEKNTLNRGAKRLNRSSLLMSDPQNFLNTSKDFIISLLVGYGG